MDPSPIKKAQEILQGVSGQKLSRGERSEQAIALAALLVQATHEEKTDKEKKEEAELARLLNDPKGIQFLTSLTDQAFRTRCKKRTQEQILFLLKKLGIPRFISPSGQIAFWLLSKLGPHLGSYFVPLLQRQLVERMSRVLLPQDPKKMAELFTRFKKEQIHINLNHIGEAILGEEEAQRRLALYLRDLEDPRINTISVKISTIFSQINHIGFSQSLEILAQRLRLLYRAAKTAPLVNLDMEEYRDIGLTLALFQKVLSEEEFLQTRGGIVLQAYLPDSWTLQKQLTEWAMERVQKGGATIRLRLVKGANLSMERVESSIRGWVAAPFETKMETDANYKRMLEYGLEKEHAQAVRIGIASHNLFDIAYAFILRAENQLENRSCFEMLSGMAAAEQRVVKKLAGELLLYCPETSRSQFNNALAYLIRRLDENGGGENFLRHAVNLEADFDEQKERFLASVQLIDTLCYANRRTQNRFLPASPADSSKPFSNEPDTDFSLPQNRNWADALFLNWETKKHSPIPLVIGGKIIHGQEKEKCDPSRPHLTLYSYSLADEKLVDRALQCAALHQREWSEMPFMQRSALLAQVAQRMREKRSDLIGAMIADGAKTIWEADPEVSEAIDFIEYYRRVWEEELKKEDIQWQAKGAILVAPPWNFPCSIAAGGISAALTAGNCVLFKPAPEAVLVGWHLVNIFWEAGIAKEVLQFICCADEPIGSYLIRHEQLKGVILTGSTETAHTFIKLNPKLDLHAETGGKNALIVTAMSDRDLAVRAIISSAFSHSGQKCSACSLAILEKEVYRDRRFQEQLLDAAGSLKVASAWDKSAYVTPLIRPPQGPLLRALTQLEEGESWLLQPKADRDNPHLWSCGIKWGVKDRSFTHQTEFFGPLLGVMEAENVNHAIRLANATPYGLTSGLHSLDAREQALWRAKICAGNLYINRTITGAIVARQPFGGTKASSFGSGAKAGGPNYVRQFAVPALVSLPQEKGPLPKALIPLVQALHLFGLSEEEQKIWKHSAESYSHWAQIFKEPRDQFKLLGQSNFFYMVPHERVWVRAEQMTSLLPLLQIVAGALISGSFLEISTDQKFFFPILENMALFQEDEEQLIARKPTQIRLLQPASEKLRSLAAEHAIFLQEAPVLPSGRLELLHYLREVSLTIETHRYGYLANP